MPVSGLHARQIDIHNIEHVQKLILEIESEQNKERKREAWVAFQCRNDNQKEYVLKELQRLYPKTWHKFRVGNIKLAKKIVEKVAKAYKQPAVRSIEKSDTETTSLNEIYDKYNFSRSFKEMDDLFILHKYVFMWLTFQNPSKPEDMHSITIEEGEYVLNALAPYEYDLVRDPVSGRPVIFALNYADTDITRLAGRSDGFEQTISESQSDTSAQTKLYRFWSPNKFTEAVVKLAAGSKTANTIEITDFNFTIKRSNPLGRIPGGYLQADTSVDYPVKNDLARTSIDWNVSLSDLKTSASTQGHGQLVISKAEGSKDEEIHMGMHTAIYLSQSKKPDAPQSSAEYISASPDLAGQLDVLKFDLMGLLDDEGVKAKNVVSGGVNQLESGFARLVDEADVQDKITDNQFLYTEIEKEIFETLRAHEKAMNQRTFKPTSKFQVSYEKPKVLISDKETLDNIEKREKLGTLLPYEKHMILDPNLDAEAAMLLEEEIQESIKKKMADLGFTGEEEVDEDEDEDEEEEVDA